MSIAVKTAEPPLGSLAVGKKPKIKTSLMLGAESKHKLSTLKADLRIRGLSVIEFVIVDIFIGATSAFMSQKSQEVKSISFVFCLWLLRYCQPTVHRRRSKTEFECPLQQRTINGSRLSGGP